MFALSAIAEETSPDSADKAAKPARGRRPAMAEIDRDAVGFARAHHPELADLLERMRKNNPRAYRAAIQDLSRDRGRLERLQGRAPERYEFELKLWTMESRIRLLAARAIRGNADEARPKLQALMQERHAFRLKHLRAEKERMTNRMARVDATIQELEKHPPSDADVDALLTKIKSRFPDGKPLKNASTKAPTADKDGANDSEKPADPQSQNESPQD